MNSNRLTIPTLTFRPIYIEGGETIYYPHIVYIPCTRQDSEELESAKIESHDAFFGPLKAKGLSTFEEATHLFIEQGSMDLHKFFIENELNDGKRYIISINILEAIEQLHQRGIVHNNITLESFLINPTTLEVKIIGFGNAKYIIDQSGVKQQQFSDERADFLNVGHVLMELWNKPLEDDVNFKMPSEVKESINNWVANNSQEGHSVYAIRVQFETLFLKSRTKSKTAFEAYRVARNLRAILPAINHPDEYLIELLNVYIEELMQQKGREMDDPVLKNAIDFKNNILKPQCFVPFEEHLRKIGQINLKLSQKLSDFIEEIKHHIIQLETRLEKPKGRLAKLRQTIINAINELSDEQIPFFLERLKLNCLNDCSTKVALLARLNEIIELSEKNIADLAEVERQLNIVIHYELTGEDFQVYSKLMEECELTNREYNAVYVGLEKYAELNTSFTHIIENLKQKATVFLKGFSDKEQQGLVEEFVSLVSSTQAPATTLQTNFIPKEEEGRGNKKTNEWDTLNQSFTENPLDRAYINILPNDLVEKNKGDGPIVFNLNNISGEDLSSSKDGLLMGQTESASDSTSKPPGASGGEGLNLLGNDKSLSELKKEHPSIEEIKGPLKAIEEIEKIIATNKNKPFSFKIDFSEYVNGFKTYLKEGLTESKLSDEIVTKIGHRINEYKNKIRFHFTYSLSSQEFSEAKKAVKGYLSTEVESLSTIAQVIDFYESLKNNYSWLRIERTFFKLFQIEGTTATWSAVISKLQEKALGIIRNQKDAGTLNLIGNQDTTLKQLFAEKNQRICIRHAAQHEYESLKRVKN